jgi:hypothetical protein
MNRRGFIGAIIGAAAAPAIVRASSLMPIVPRAGYVWTPSILGLQALVAETEIMQTMQGVESSFSEMVALTLARHRMDIESSIAQSNALYRHISLTRAFQQE